MKKDVLWNSLVPWKGSAWRLPDGDGVSRPSSDVPAAVQSGWILEGPTGAGDDAAGRPQELRHVAAGCTEKHLVSQTVEFEGFVNRWCVIIVAVTSPSEIPDT